MGDRIDDLMTRRWPKISEAVSGGLDVKPAVDNYVPADPMKDSRPYRVTGMKRDEVIPGWPGLVVCQPVLEGAFELSLTIDLAVNDLEDEDGFTQAIEEVRRFAREARLSERRALLLLLDAGAGRIAPYTHEGVLESIDLLSRPCRLIASPGEISKWAERHGVVEESVDPQVELPSGAGAILLSLGDGPRWRRVVDDLLPTWQRQSTTEVRLRLSERFFLDDPNRAVRLV